MPINPTGGNPPEFTIPSGPANYGGPSNFSGIQDSITSMAHSSVELNKTMGEFVSAMSDAYDTTARLAEKTDDIKANYKEVVISSDRMVDTFKAAATLQKDFNSKILSQKHTYKEIEEHVRGLLELNNKLLKSGLGSAQVASIKNNMKTLQGVLNDVNSKAKVYGVTTKAADEATREWQQTLASTTRHVAQLANSMGKLEMTRMERQVRSVNKAYASQGAAVKILGAVEDFYSKRKVLRDTQREVKEQKDLRQAGYRAKMEAAAGKAAKHLMMDLPRKENGSIDFKALSKNKRVNKRLAKSIDKTDFDELAKQVAFRGGSGMIGGLDKFLSGKVLRKRARVAAGLEPPGSLGKMGMRMADAGEGSVLGGMAEGGLTKLLPAVAIISAVVDVALKFIDKVAITNQAIEKGMGGALFTPGKSGGMALKNVRDNLSANFFNAYGQNLERNLSVAQAMQEQGFDITELSNKNIRGKRLAGGGMPNTSEGFLGGTFGEFQRNSMTAGRSMGQSTPQTVARMTKMLNEMRQSFNAVTDFLEGANKQARAAGISTTAYLSILDGLTDKFDSMNKSLVQSISVIQTLGATSTATAQDLKDMTSFITGADETKTNEQNIFAFAQMSEASKKRWVEDQQDTVDDAVGKLHAGLLHEGGFTESQVSQMNLSSGGGVLAAENSIMASTASAGVKQNLKKLAEEAFAQYNQLGVAKEVQRGNFVGAGLGLQAVGSNMETKTRIQQQLLESVMKYSKISVASLRKNPEQLLNNPLAIEMAKAMNLKPEDLNTLAQTAGSFQGGMLISGAANMRTGKSKDEEYQKILMAGKKVGVFTGINATDKDMQANIQKQLGDQGTFAKVAQELEEEMTPEDFVNALHTTMLETNKVQNDSQVKDVVELTRTSGDIIANSFEKFFTELVDVLYDIKNILSFHWFKGVLGTPSKETTAMIDEMRSKGMFSEAEGSLKSASDAGDKAATTHLAQLQAFDMIKPENRSETDAQNAASIIRANSISSISPTNMSSSDWNDLMQKPNITNEALDEQFIRSTSGNTSGGQFGKLDSAGNSNRFWLGKNLYSDQFAAIDKLATNILGSGIQTDKATGAQYINITMNSTDIAAFMTRFEQEMHNIKAPGNSGETTIGANGGAMGTGKTQLNGMKLMP